VHHAERAGEQIPGIVRSQRRLDEAISRVVDVRDVALLEGATVVVGEAIDAHDFIAGVQELTHSR